MRRGAAPRGDHEVDADAGDDAGVGYGDDGGGDDDLDEEDWPGGHVTEPSAGPELMANEDGAVLSSSLPAQTPSQISSRSWLLVSGWLVR